MALEWFNANKGFYHPVAVNSLEKLLGIDQATLHMNQRALDRYEEAIQDRMSPFI